MQMSKAKQMSLGFQHVLAMYAGAVVVPLIVGNALGLTAAQLTYLIAIDIMMCGVATILQVWKKRFSGIGLPVVLGCTFTAVGPMIAIGNTYGIPAIYGSILVAGLFVILIATFFSNIVKLFPPVVTGTVITIIGITLVPVAMNDIAGGQGRADYGYMTNFATGFIQIWKRFYEIHCDIVRNCHRHGRCIIYRIGRFQRSRRSFLASSAAGIFLRCSGISFSPDTDDDACRDSRAYRSDRRLFRSRRYYRK